jgi:hypothetical protein
MVMHKTGAWLQVLVLRGDPRWQVQEQALRFPPHQLLTPELARILRQKCCNLTNAMYDIYIFICCDMQKIY